MGQHKQKTIPQTKTLGKKIRSGRSKGFSNSNWHRFRGCIVELSGGFFSQGFKAKGAHTWMFQEVSKC